MDKGKYGRLDRLVQEKRHDPYEPREKFPEPTICKQCGAVYMDGRWTWTDNAPEKANMAICPACRRIKDHLPAGTLTLTGKFLQSHGSEIMNLIKNEERAEKAKHPLERIMEIKQESGSIVVLTTGIHVARRIGEAIHNSYHGDYELKYGDAEKTVSIAWHRD